MSVEVYSITRTDLHVKVQNELEWTSVKTELRLILDVRSKIKPGNGGDFPFLGTVVIMRPRQKCYRHTRQLDCNWTNELPNSTW